MVPRAANAGTWPNLGKRSDMDDCKRCTKCGEPKPLSGFHRDRNRKDGHRDWCRVCVRADHAANKERIKAKHRAWLAANADRVRSSHADWLVKNRDRVLATSAAYREANRVLIRQRKAAKLDVSRGYCQKRRALLIGARTGDPIIYREIRQRDQGICWLCGKPCPPHDITYDHAIPLSRGGQHSTRNLRLAHDLCNKRKWTTSVTHQPFLL